MAQRPSRQGFFEAFQDFEQTVDSLFDDLLISRWRVPSRAAKDPRVKVADLGDHYEVRMEQVAAEARDIEIESNERRLVVNTQSGGGAGSERVVDFRHPVDPEGARAELQGTELRITLPKLRPRKITVR